jgi:hypothetical protein
LRGKPGLIVHFLRGVLEFCRRIKVLNADRKRVQRERLVSDRKILRIMIGSVGFSKGARKKWEKQQARAGGSSNP